MTDIHSLGDTSWKSAEHTLHLLHPQTKEPLVRDDGTKVEITFVSLKSEEAEEANIQNRVIAQEMAGSGAETAEMKRFEDKAWHRQLAYCTRKWSGIPKSWLTGPDAPDANDDLPFIRENAIGVYARLDWIRDQLATEMRKIEGFGKASKSAS